MLSPLLIIPYPVIDPILLQIGPLAIRWYSLAYIFGIVIGWRIMRDRALRPHLWGAVTPPETRLIDDFLLVSTLGVIIGGRFGYALFYDPVFYLSHPQEILAIWRGGMSFHGGFAGFVIALLLYARTRRAAILPLLDLAALAAPPGLFLGRLANFINDELWGRVASVPWAMVFPSGGPLPRHPSQLYEAAGEGILLFAALWFVHQRFSTLACPGLTAGLFAIGYCVARIASEFFREPDGQIGYLLGGYVTMGMALSVPLAIGGAALIYFAWRRRRAQ